MEKKYHPSTKYNFPKKKSEKEIEMEGGSRKEEERRGNGDLGTSNT